MTIWNMNLSSHYLATWTVQYSEEVLSPSSSIFFKSRGGTWRLSNYQVIQEVCGRAGNCSDLAGLSLLSLTNRQSFLCLQAASVNCAGIYGLICHHKSSTAISVFRAPQKKLNPSLQCALSAPKETFTKDGSTTHLNATALLKINKDT